MELLFSFTQPLQKYSLAFFLEGKQLAKKYGIKYIETSPGKNLDLIELTTSPVTTFIFMFISCLFYVRLS